MRRVPVASDVDISLLARQTPGFAGADLENLVNEAALLAARKNKDRVEMIDFELSKDKVLMGSERRSMVLSLEERRNTAFHEAGHALVAKLIPGTDPVHKVTIIPRGMALGLTQQVPIDDRHTYTRDFLINNLAILFGGRVAEELCLQHMTTGAGNDLERATELARKMVCEWGMSERLGPMTFGKKEEQIFLGRDFTQLQDYSQGTAEEIDKEVRRLIQDAYERAKGLLTANLQVLHRMAEVLLEKESLDGTHIDEIIKQIGASGDGKASEPVAAAAS
jgi:cell division protease FtsH